MLKLSLTLINKKSVATHLSIRLLETAASKMRNWNRCKTRANKELYFQDRLLGGGGGYMYVCLLTVI